MSRPRGNKTSKAERAARQAEALELMKTNPNATQDAIAELLGVSRMTFWRDLQAIEARYVAGSAEDLKQFKAVQYDALIRIENATAEGSIEPDVANALVRIRDSVAKLLGLNAPDRKIVGHQSLNPVAKGWFGKFNQHGARFRTEESWNKIFAFMDLLPDDYDPQEEIKRRGLRTMAEIQADEQKLLGESSHSDENLEEK